jgi:minor extracellular serine protease Vpr
VFAVDTLNRWSNASTVEFDIYVDVDSDGTDDYVVVGADQGAVTAGSDNGVLAAFAFSLRSGRASASAFGAFAPSDGSTALIPIRTSQLCMSSEPCLSKTGNPRLTYHIVTFDRLSPAFDVVPGVAAFNVWSPAISNGDFQAVPAGGSATSPVSIDPVEWGQTPAKGVMVVSHDNKAGKEEALLLPLGLK